MGQDKQLFQLQDDMKKNKKLALLERDMDIKITADNDTAVDFYTNISSERKENFKKTRWGTKNTMLCGFKMAEKVIDFSKVKTWIDIGCGTGDFFDYILPKYKIEYCVGTDVVKKFTRITANKLHQLVPDISYCIYTKNLYELDVEEIGKFDLVTLSGVLQILDLNKIYQSFNILDSFVNHGGILWINTTNYDYKSVNQRRKQGLWHYKQEELQEIYKKYNYKNIDVDIFNIKADVVCKEDGRFIYSYGVKNEFI